MQNTIKHETTYTRRYLHIYTRDEYIEIIEIFPGLNIFKNQGQLFN